MFFVIKICQFNYNTKYVICKLDSIILNIIYYSANHILVKK